MDTSQRAIYERIADVHTALTNLRTALEQTSIPAMEYEPSLYGLLGNVRDLGTVVLEHYVRNPTV